MSIAQANRLLKNPRRPSGAFTLLEITLAVAILAMMSLAIYRFVQSNLIALRVSSESNATAAQYSGLVNLLTAQWQNLPTGTGALLGEPLKLDGQSRDTMTWICGAGPGLLTRYATGEFEVNLRLRRDETDHLRIGIFRKPKGEPNSSSRESWVPLLEGVQTLEIRYFDPRLNTWVDKWTDTGTLPRLVRLVIGRAGYPVPFEAIIALGRTPL